MNYEDKKTREHARSLRDHCIRDDHRPYQTLTGRTLKWGERCPLCWTVRVALDATKESKNEQ